MAAELADLSTALRQDTGAKTWEEYARIRNARIDQAIARVRDLAKADLKVK